jgi:hypothetical protein
VLPILPLISMLQSVETCTALKYGRRLNNILLYLHSQMLQMRIILVQVGANLCGTYLSAHVAV